MIFGRYWAAKSPVHALDPRMKLVMTLLLIIGCFIPDAWLGQAIIAVFLIVVYRLSKIPVRAAIRTVLPLMFIVVLTMLFNLLWTQGGDVYVHWGIIQISQAGVYACFYFGVRLTLLLFCACLLTLTTTILDITDASEMLLDPLRKVRVPVHELTMIAGIALRFLPLFAREAATIRDAQLARAAVLSYNPFRGGIRTVSSLVVPLFSSAFRHAETLSNAMDARCYHGGEGRTRLYPMRSTWRDWVALGIVCALIAILVIVRILL